MVLKVRQVTAEKPGTAGWEVGEIRCGEGAKNVKVTGRAQEKSNAPGATTNVKGGVNKSRGLRHPNSRESRPRGRRGLRGNPRPGVLRWRHEDSAVAARKPYKQGEVLWAPHPGGTQQERPTLVPNGTVVEIQISSTPKSTQAV